MSGDLLFGYPIVPSPNMQKGQAMVFTLPSGIEQIAVHPDDIVAIKEQVTSGLRPDLPVIMSSQKTPFNASRAVASSISQHTHSKTPLPHAQVYSTMVANDQLVMCTTCYSAIPVLRQQQHDTWHATLSAGIAGVPITTAQPAPDPDIQRVPGPEDKPRVLKKVRRKRT